VKALGYLRIMFAVEDIDDTLARLRPHGAELVGELAQYEDEYRLCYVRGPEGILIGLAEQLGQRSNFRDGRAPQASFPNAGPVEVTASMSSAGLRCDRDDQTSGQLG
jgi:hypothetical protein